MNILRYRHTITIIVLPIFTWLFYSGILMPGCKLRTEEAPHNYYKDFAAAFMSGKLHADDCPAFSFCQDLVRYDNKLYMYWPPVPVFIYMPLVKAYGLHTPDNMIGAVFGSLNVLLLYLFLYRLGKRFANFKWRYAVILAIMYGFGTVHFYLSMSGEVWFLAEVIAQFFLLLSMNLILRSKNLAILLLSGFCFACAAYTRNTLLFSFIFIACLYWVEFKPAWKKAIGSCIMFLIPFILFSIVNLYYNYVRFGTVFENGLTYHQMDGHFVKNFKAHGFFSLHYIPGNTLRELFWPLPLTSKFPFFLNDPEGIGMFWVSPMLVLVFPAMYFLLKKRRQEKPDQSNIPMVLGIGSTISAICIALVIFSIMGAGYEQFGARYTLDFQVFIMIPIFLYLQAREKPFSFWGLSALLLVSVYIQFIGVRMYFGM